MKLNVLCISKLILYEHNLLYEKWTFNKCMSQVIFSIIFAALYFTVEVFSILGTSFKNGLFNLIRQH